MWNGDKTPAQSSLVYGKISGSGANANFNVKPSGDSPYYSSSMTEGAYKIEISPYSGDFSPKKMMWVNLKANQAGTTTTQDSPPIRRPRRGRGRGSSGRGNYVTPRTSRRSSRRRTPAPQQGTKRKGYVWFVVPMLMFNEQNISQHCDIKVYYLDWSNWYDTWDPNSLPPEENKSLFNSGVVTLQDIKIKFDANSEVTTKIEIKLNKPSNSSTSIWTGENESLSSETHSLVSDGEIVMKITQLGTPYVLQYKLKDDFAANLVAGTDPYKNPREFNVSLGGNAANDRQTLMGNTNTISNTILLDIGKLSNVSGTIKMDIIPPPQPGSNLEKLIKYLDYIESSLQTAFVNRRWIIEIIDKSTLRPEDPYEWPGVDTNGDGKGDSNPTGAHLDFDPFDDVYNQLERLIIYLK
jgi:hypothetical protein